MSRIAFSISLLLSLTLGACGFAPVYGSRAPLPVSIAVPGDTREAFTLRRALEDEFGGGSASSAYRLDAQYTVTKQPAIIDRDGRAARYNLVIGVPYRLSGKGLNESGTVTTYASYTVPESDFSAFAQERHAVADALQEAARILHMRLLPRLAALQP